MIYTTYFANLRNLPKDIVPISICGKAPDWYKGLQYKKLAPKYDFFMEWKQNHDNEYYIEHFQSEVLDTLDIREVLNDLYDLSLNEDFALVCYEKPTDFCHRHLVGDWINNNSILECIEFDKNKVKTKIYYAGIGSRETPQDTLQIFSNLASNLSTKGFILRSGGASGADKSFENGCNKANGEKEIYLPWSGFENSNSTLVVSNPKAYEIAEKFHPYWHNLSNGAKKLQARNSHQVLGENLETPSAFVICWTKNGKGSGGTGQAIRIAKAYNIPVFDAGEYESVDETKKELMNFLLVNTHLTYEDFI